MLDSRENREKMVQIVRVKCVYSRKLNRRELISSGCLISANPNLIYENCPATVEVGENGEGNWGKGKEEEEGERGNRRSARGNCIV